MKSRRKIAALAEAVAAGPSPSIAMTFPLVMLCATGKGSLQSGREMLRQVDAWRVAVS
jgi:hypothetical protein